MEHRHGMTLRRLREHLARTDGELEATQYFLDPEIRQRTRWLW